VFSAYETGFKMVIKNSVILLVLITLVVSFVFYQRELSGKDEERTLEKYEFYYSDEDSKNYFKVPKIFDKPSKTKMSIRPEILLVIVLFLDDFF